MSNFLLALLISASASVWIYSKLMRNTGGVTKNALTAAAISGALIFVIVLIVANMAL